MELLFVKFNENDTFFRVKALNYESGVIYIVSDDIKERDTKFLNIEKRYLADVDKYRGEPVYKRIRK